MDAAKPDKAQRALPEKAGLPGRVTAEWLERKGARCDCEQLDLFRKTFPDGADPTAANLRRAAEAGLDVGWFAMVVLGREARAAFLAGEKRALTAFRVAQDRAEADRGAGGCEAYDAAVVRGWKELWAETAEALIAALGLETAGQGGAAAGRGGDLLDASAEGGGW